MIFTETHLKGAYFVDLEPRSDERGFFARTWCQHEFEAIGLNHHLAQCNLSYNKIRGTLRGMHYQIAPYQETKLVRCTAGAIYDVIVDLRPNSATFKQWLAIELTALNRRAIYIPPEFAHGFQTLTDNTEVFYQMSEFFQPEAARGLRWNDPTFAFVWPLEIRSISDKDQQYPNWEAPK